MHEASHASAASRLPASGDPESIRPPSVEEASGIALASMLAASTEGVTSASALAASPLGVLLFALLFPCASPVVVPTAASNPFEPTAGSLPTQPAAAAPPIVAAAEESKRKVRRP
jgi:hypothetical protein